MEGTYQRRYEMLRPNFVFRENDILIFLISPAQDHVSEVITEFKT